MVHRKRSMKHRKSYRKHTNARRTRARRGGYLKCSWCGKESVTVKQPGGRCLSCSDRINNSAYTTSAYIER